MKKIILMLGAVALLCITACQKETSGTAGSEKGNAAASEEKIVNSGVIIDGVAIPKFSNPEVQQFATEYATMVSQMAAAAKSDDVAKIEELKAKSQEWTAAHGEWSSKMTPQDSKLWTYFITELSQAERKK